MGPPKLSVFMSSAQTSPAAGSPKLTVGVEFAFLTLFENYADSKDELSACPPSALCEWAKRHARAPTRPPFPHHFHLRPPQRLIASSP